MLRFFLTFLIVYFTFITHVFAGIFISEIFPNTTDDKNLEYIELINTGTEEIDIFSYYLQDKSEKQYIFPEDTFIQSGEKIKYLRLDTKIILNNSNEEIYLYSDSGELLDTLTYSTSTKGEVIIGENLEENLDETLSGDIVPEVGDDNFDELLSWLTGQEIPQVQEMTISYLPSMIWSFQQPTYLLDGEQQLYAYTCERQECKMNLDLRESFGDNIKETDYRCEIDFGFETGEEGKCNPNTVEFGVGTFDIQMKIFDIVTDTLIIESKFIIENTPQIEIGTDFEIHNSSDHISIDESTQEIMLDLKSPDILIDLQRPSYVEKNGDLYTCDTSEDECKINFNLGESFNSEYKEGDYICFIDFGFETGEEEKCNPNTIIFPVGEHNISIKIIHEENKEIFTEKNIQVINTGYEETEVSESEDTLTEIEDIQDLYIGSPRIDIQSGLISLSDSYSCQKSDCKVNLMYEPVSDHEICEWTFGGAVFYTEGTEKKCNPGYVHYEYGDFEITLRVYQKDNPSNYEETYLSFINSNQPIDIRDIENNSIDERLLKKKKSVSKIIVQGKIGKSKLLEDNKITCFGVLRCSVNFTSEPGDNISKDAIYSWDFGNGEIYIGKNPKGIWFEQGSYEVKLFIQSSTGNEFFIFIVEVKSEEDNSIVIVEESEEISLIGEDISEQYSQEYLHLQSMLSIGNISPNPKGNDDKERLEIINKGNEVVNMKGCEIDDIRDGGSRSYKIKQDLFIPAGETHRFYKIFSGLNLNNAGDEVNLICNESMVDSFGWDFKTGDNLVLTDSYPTGEIMTNSDIAEKFFVYNSEGLLDEILSNEKYNQFINKTFRQNERLLKSGFKISGETIPNSKIRIILGNSIDDIYLMSDENGLYEVLLDTGLKSGSFILKTEVLTSHGEVFLFQSEKQLEISSEYITSLIKVKKAKKTKKVAIKKPKTFFVSVANASGIGDVRKEESYAFVFLFIIVLLGFLISFFALSRRGVFD